MIPEGQGSLPNLTAFRIRPTAHEPDPYTSSASSSRRVTFEGLPAPAADEEVQQRGELRRNYVHAESIWPAGGLSAMSGSLKASSGTLLL